MEQALGGKPIAEPLTVYDCSLISDGAAAVVICAAGTRGGVHDQAGDACWGSRRHRTTSRSMKKTTSPHSGRCGRRPRRPIKMAGVTPADIQFAELHDCFTIAEIVATEDLGFVEEGRGRAVRARRRNVSAGRAAGEYQRRSEVEGPSGGRDRRGRRSATSAMQIRGEAGERQMARHELGLAQNLGGSGATSRGDDSGGCMKGTAPFTRKRWSYVAARSVTSTTRRISSRSSSLKTAGGSRRGFSAIAWRSAMRWNSSNSAIDVPFFEEVMKLAGADDAHRRSNPRSKCWCARGRWKAQGRDIIHLEIGEPDFSDAPAHRGSGQAGARRGLDALRADAGAAGAARRHRGLCVAGRAASRSVPERGLRRAGRQADDLFPDAGAVWNRATR